MLNNFVGKDIINIGDMTPDQFQYLLDLSKMLKAEKMTGVDHARFHNKNVVAHFEWESTRTRCAFETSAMTWAWASPTCPTRTSATRRR